MPFSHHSHSGQFCPGHAKDSLEDVIQAAISKKMQVFCLTEHMPRHKEDFYPEEVTTPKPTTPKLEAKVTTLPGRSRPNRRMALHQRSRLLDRGSPPPHQICLSNPTSNRLRMRLDPPGIQVSNRPLTLPLPIRVFYWQRAPHAYGADRLRSGNV